MDSRSAGGRGNLYPDLRRNMGSLDAPETVDAFSNDNAGGRIEQERNREPIGLQIDPTNLEAFQAEGCCIGLYLDDGDRERGNLMSEMDVNGSFLSLEDSQGDEDSRWNNLTHYVQDVSGESTYGEVELNDKDYGSIVMKQPSRTKSPRSHATTRQTQDESDVRSVSSRSARSTRSVHTNPGVLLNNKPQRARKEGPKQTSATERLTQFGATMTKVRSSGSVHSIGALQARTPRTVQTGTELQASAAISTGTREDQSDDGAENVSSKNASWTKNKNVEAKCFDFRDKDIFHLQSKAPAKPGTCKEPRLPYVSDCKTMLTPVSLGRTHAGTNTYVQNHVKAEHKPTFVAISPTTSNSETIQIRFQGDTLKGDARNRLLVDSQNSFNSPQANTTRPGLKGPNTVVASHNNASYTGYQPERSLRGSSLGARSPLTAADNNEFPQGHRTKTKTIPTTQYQPVADHKPTYALGPLSPRCPQPRIGVNSGIQHPSVVDSNNVFDSRPTTRPDMSQASSVPHSGHYSTTMNRQMEHPRAFTPPIPHSSYTNVSPFIGQHKTHGHDNSINSHLAVPSPGPTEKKNFQEAMKKFQPIPPISHPMGQLPENQSSALTSPSGARIHQRLQHPIEPNPGISTNVYDRQYTCPTVNDREHNVQNHLMNSRITTAAKPKSSTGRLPLVMGTHRGPFSLVGSPTTSKNGKNKLKNGAIPSLGTQDPFDLLFPSSPTQKSLKKGRNHANQDSSHLQACKPKKSSSFGSLGALVGGLRRGKNKEKA